MADKKTETKFHWGRASVAFVLFIVLFACGVAVGLFWNSGKTHIKEIVQYVESKEPKAKQPPAKNCSAIEKVLEQKLSGDQEDSLDIWEHVDRAEVYAILAERGCPENSENYKSLALREIEIARALSNDRFNDDNQTIMVIDTYKKLNMKAEAEKVFEKAKKLTDPAIDFIIQVERIFSE